MNRRPKQTTMASKVEGQWRAAILGIFGFSAARLQKEIPIILYLKGYMRLCLSLLKRPIYINILALLFFSSCATIDAPTDSSLSKLASALEKSPLKVGLHISPAVQSYGVDPWGFGEFNIGRYIASSAQEDFKKKFQTVKNLSQLPLSINDQENLDLVIVVEQPKGEFQNQLFMVDVRLTVSFSILLPTGETLDKHQSSSKANVVMGSLNPGENLAKAREATAIVSHDAVVKFLQYFTNEKEPEIRKILAQRKFEREKIEAEIFKNLQPLNANYRVVESAAVVRRQPSPDAKKIRSIARGGILQVIGKLPSGWLQVAKQGEPIGWVHGDSLKKETVVFASPAPFASPSKSDSTPPSIINTSHRTGRDGKVIENLSRTTISGKATDPSGVAEVKVNEQTTSLDKDGNFTADVFLKVGDNKIIVTAMDVQENIGRQTFTIKRNPKTTMVRKGEISDQKDFGRFYALIIGNNNYTHLPNLNTARNDAQEVEKVLREKYGFETEALLDATRTEILRGLNRIRKRLKQKDSFLFYYAGHGVFDESSDRAYWLPVDAQPDDDSNWIIADTITSSIKRFSSNHVLIVADSCYSGTMTRSLETEVKSKGARDRYLKKMLNKSSRTLMASGGNEPVADSGGGKHSVFAQVFLSALNTFEQKVFTAEELFYSYVKESVSGKAEQTPKYSIIRNSGHDGGDFLFVRE